MCIYIIYEKRPIQYISFGPEVGHSEVRKDIPEGGREG